MLFKSFRMLFQSFRMVFQSFRTVFQSFQTVFQSFRMMFQSFRMVFQWFRTVFQSFRMVFQSFREVFQSFRTVFQSFRTVFHWDSTDFSIGVLRDRKKKRLDRPACANALAGRLLFAIAQWWWAGGIFRCIRSRKRPLSVWSALATYGCPQGGKKTKEGK